MTVCYDNDFKMSLVRLVNAVLESVVSVFEQADIDLPSKRYVTPAQVAHDKEELVVSFVQLYPGVVGVEPNEPQPCETPRTAVLAVELVRCVPTSGRTGGPSEESLQAYGDSRLIDAYMLLEAGMRATDQWGIGVIADVTVGQPGGGMQAVTLNLTIGVP